MIPSRVALVGNPNSGKTTLFNLITGLNQRIGNWSGVTVERHEGTWQAVDHSIEVVDLPGIYSLLRSGAESVDLQVTCQYLEQQIPECIINVVDACNIERHLYLTLQLRTLGLPMLVVLNRYDLAEKRGLSLDIKALAKKLDCPVIAFSAHRVANTAPLFEAIQSIILPVRAFTTSESRVVAAIAPLMPLFSGPLAYSKAERLIEGDVALAAALPETAKPLVEKAKQEIQTLTGWDPEIALAQKRYSIIESWLPDIQHRKPSTRSFTATFDRAALHKVWGLPLFLLVLYTVFVFAISVGGLFEPIFDVLSSLVFVDTTAHLLQNLHAPPWIIALVAHGIGRGLNTTLTFIPVIGCMFLILSFLEDSGYMARAALVMDGLMRAIGLPGKAFVPLIIGFGCNVPAIMATRTLESKRDRILTAMMSPFMSCGARLAIFAAFVSAFFSGQGGWIVFSLYSVGILCAIATGFMLKHTILEGEPQPLLLELPVYQWPTFKSLWYQAYQRLSRFVSKAGKLIVPLCVVIGVLNTLTSDGVLHHQPVEDSLLAVVGRQLTPVFEPMGITEENWPATVGLLTGVLAKEVVVGTLNALYTQELGDVEIVPQSLKDRWHAGFTELRQEWGAGGDATLLNPRTFGLMAERFGSPYAAFAYLLFVLLYFPCVSATAAMAREVSWGWTLFSLGWTTGIAYIVAVVYYQVVTFNEHPADTLLWIMGSALVLGAVVAILKRYGRQPIVKKIPTRVVMG